MPWLAKFYKYVYEPRRRGWYGLVQGVILRRTFRLIHKCLRVPAWGIMEYSNVDTAVQVRFDGRNTQYHAVYLEKYRAGYEPETCALLDAFLSENSVFWDVGSNWGYFALYACSHPKFQGVVHAFEPVQSTFSNLRDVIRRTGLDGRVYCHPFALGKHDERLTAVLADGIHSGLAQLCSEGAGESVEVRRADSLDLPDPSILKLDVEGFEAAVLQGAMSMINRAAPMILMESWLNEDVQACLASLQRLEDCGYHLFRPVWLFQTEDGQYLSPSNRPKEGRKPTKLILHPFEAVERPILGEYANLLACHNSRMSELYERFCPLKLDNATSGI